MRQTTVNTTRTDLLTQTLREVVVAAVLELLTGRVAVARLPREVRLVAAVPTRRDLVGRHFRSCQGAAQAVRSCSKNTPLQEGEVGRCLRGW